MAEILNMPKYGMDMEEGIVLRWLKKPGDPVQEGEVIAEIESDKASMDFESPVNGVVLRLYCREEESVPVNHPIIAIGQPGESLPECPGEPEAPAPVPEQVQGQAAVPDQAPPVPVKEPALPSESNQFRISPRARRLAEKYGVDPRHVPGSGTSGRIVERDIREYMRQNGENPPTARVPRKESVLPMAGIRKVIAGRMHKSLSEMAQANHRMDVDMTNMTALRKQLNDGKAFPSGKVSFVDLLILACSRALLDCPYANASLEPDGIHQKAQVNIGVAVDTPKGLVVPVVKHVEQMDLQRISAENQSLIKKARDGNLRPDEMTGGTFTITNLGMFGIDSFTAIINPPEACILATGRIAQRVVVVDDAPAVRPVMTLSLTYDHRILDGAPAARLLQRIQYYIENPALLLLPETC